MQDIIPGLAPDPKTVVPLLSLGISERLSRPILDHMLLGTLQACNTMLSRNLLDEVFDNS